MADYDTDQVYLRVLLEGEKSEWLNLPVEAPQLRQAFGRLGVTAPDGFRVAGVDSPYESIGAALAGESNLDALNTIAIFLSDMEDYEIDKVCAIAQMDLSQYGDTLDVFINVLGSDDNFTGFDMIDAHNETELGKYWADDENLDMTPDELAAYGRENMEDGGIFTQWGYIRCKFEPEMLYDSDNLPEGCSITDAAFQVSAPAAAREFPPVYSNNANVARQNGKLDQPLPENRASVLEQLKAERPKHEARQVKTPEPERSL